MTPILPAVLASAEELIPIVAVGGAFSVAIVAIVGGLLRSILRTRAREQTKRDIAAYIAEGSMSPADGERLLRADMPAWERGKD